MMKKMRNLLMWMLVLGIGTLMQGCVTDVAQAKLDGVAAAGAPVDDSGSAAMESAMRALNVHVGVGTDAGKDAALVGDELRKSIEGELAAKHFTVSAATPDIAVSLAPTVSLFDKSGSYYRYNGKVDVKVMRSRDSRVMGEKKFLADGARKLDQDQALMEVGQKLAPDVAKWVAEICVPSQMELAACDITVHRFLPAAPSSDSRYAVMFVEKVGAIPGVISCRLARHDYESRALVFRVVYSHDLVPQFLMDQVAAIRELKIRAK